MELMERLEIDCTPIFLRSASEIYLSGWDWGLEGDPRVKEGPVLQEIRTALDQDYDLLIMANTATDKLPADVLRRIEEKIEKGCGLVYISASPPARPWKSGSSATNCPGPRRQLPTASRWTISPASASAAAEKVQNS